MTNVRALVCQAPAAPPRLTVQEIALSEPGHGEVLVEQVASSINPIDVKRAGGYGSRLLSLRGAGRFPIVLGNDVAGVVRAVGPGVSGLQPGMRVVGLVPTGPRGAHASQLVADARWLRPAPTGADLVEIAALPYNFTTMWIALRSAGIDASTARDRKVLIHGAAGGLGRMALHVLRGWGAEVTAVDRAELLPACARLGAHELVARGPEALQQLPADFSAILNFGGWEDDALLSARLGPHALGHATTVHPLLSRFDAEGWLRGAIGSWNAYGAARGRVRARAPQARYAWVVFQPDAAALDGMCASYSAGLRLPVGWVAGLDEAVAGFEHVRSGAFGRAVLRLDAGAPAHNAASQSEPAALAK
jgi:D-arabinose 1-dehydrogenase-like Zn-dependent alcohol dehydrogenase